MTPSPLSLEDVLVRRLVVRLHEALPGEPQQSAAMSDCDEDYRMTVDFEVGASQDDPRRFCVFLDIAFSRHPQRALARFDRVAISLVGFFSISETASPEVLGAVIPGNCLAMLHGAARGVVMSATAAFPGGRFMIPAVNFVDLIARKAKADVRARRTASSTEATQAACP